MITLLALAVALFAAIHLIPAVPTAKTALKTRWGKKYGLIFATASLISLAFIILAWRQAPVLPVYDPPANGHYVTFTLVLTGFAFLGIFLFRGAWRQRLRFPLAFGVICWAMGHLFIRGDLASLILFGGLGTYALLHIILGFYNGIQASGEARAGHDLFGIVIGIALGGVMAQMHQFIIGIPVLTLIK